MTKWYHCLYREIMVMAMGPIEDGWTKTPPFLNKSTLTNDVYKIGVHLAWHILCAYVLPPAHIYCLIETSIGLKYYLARQLAAATILC
jgi:hypothetical protein